MCALKKKKICVVSVILRCVKSPLEVKRFHLDIIYYTDFILSRIKKRSVLISFPTPATAVVSIVATMYNTLYLLY